MLGLPTRRRGRTSTDARLRALDVAAASTLLARVAASASAIGFSLSVARAMSQHDAGRFFVASAVMTMLLPLAARGIDRSVLPVLTRVRRVNGVTAAAQAHRSALVQVGASASAAAVTVFAAAIALVPVIGSHHVSMTGLLCFAAVPLALVHTQSQVARARHQTARGVWVDAITYVGATGTIWLTSGDDGTGAALSLAIGASIAYMVTVPIVGTGQASTSAGARLELRRIGRTLAWDAVATQVGERAPTVVLSGVSVASSAAFAVARQASSGALALQSTARLPVAPHLGELYAGSGPLAMAVLARRAARRLALVTLPGVVALGVGAPWVLRLFGSGYEEAAWALRVLLIGRCADIATGFTAQILLMTDHATDLRRSSMLRAVATIALASALVPLYGMVGGAIAIAASQAVTQGWLWQVVRSRTGHRVDVFALTGAIEPAKSTT